MQKETRRSGLQLRKNRGRSGAVVEILELDGNRAIRALLRQRPDLLDQVATDITRARHPTAVPTRPKQS